MYHKIVNAQVPDYLRSSLPPLVSENVPYNLRREFEREGLAWDLCRFKDSFFPQTSSLWNALPQYIQSSDSIGRLKHFLSANDPIIPIHYYTGNRKEQLIHCKLRLGMSDLNQDMVNRHIAQNAFCECGHNSENSQHYLLHCPRYRDCRIQTILNLPPEHRRLNILLAGSNSLSQAENLIIFHSVHQFIQASRRFK